jgi:hypothetical protein
VIALEGESVEPDAVSLLSLVMKGGVRVAPPEALADVRARAKAEMAALPDRLRRIDEEPTEPYPVSASPRLSALVEEVRARVKLH